MSTMTHDFAGSRFAGGHETQTGLLARMASWQERRRTVARITRELMSYTDRELMDLGLTRGDISDVANGRLTR